MRARAVGTGRRLFEWSRSTIGSEHRGTNPLAYWAYYSADHLTWLRARGPIPRIARPGIESGERLGRHRWKIERSISRLFGYRRLTVRYERKGSHFLAFLGLAAALTATRSPPNSPRETSSNS
ncbi:transposase [Streptomyces sp. V4I8]|uniref:hypothetical protein n=1 Tax=Streptomyces sp. V4I8 TaxID=3156469 RepID=UPI00351422E8